MNRLPEYDNKTGRSETLAFLGLGLAGIALMVFATLDAGRFAVNRECIVAELTEGKMPPHKAVAVVETNSALTNLAVMRSISSPQATSVTPAVFSQQDGEEGTTLGPVTVVPKLKLAWPKLRAW